MHYVQLEHQSVIMAVCFLAVGQKQHMWRVWSYPGGESGETAHRKLQPAAQSTGDLGIRRKGSKKGRVVLWRKG